MNINYQIPDSLHRSLKMLAAIRGMTLKDTIIGLLIAGIKDVAEELPEGDTQ